MKLPWFEEMILLSNGLIWFTIDFVISLYGILHKLIGLN